MDTEGLNEARTLLRGAKYVLVVTGAGISAESGVPVFRGSGENWRNKHFTELASPSAFCEDPRLIWDWYLYRRQVLANCVPNAGHRALAAWAAERTGVTLLTQNVDHLHEEAGHAGVTHLHGSIWRNRCTGCGRERDARELTYETLPLSPCCNMLERPAIVWFGEQILTENLIRGRMSIWSGGAVLVVGTSGFVSTVSYLTDDARAFRVPVINVNIEPSLIEADYDLYGSAGTILPQLLE